MKTVACKEVMYAGKLERQLGCSVNQLYCNSPHSLLFQHNVTDFSFSLLIKLNNRRESNLITDNGFLAASCEALGHYPLSQDTIQRQSNAANVISRKRDLLHGLLMEDLACPYHSPLCGTKPFEVSWAVCSTRENFRALPKIF